MLKLTPEQIKKLDEFYKDFHEDDVEDGLFTMFHAAMNSEDFPFTKETLDSYLLMTRLLTKLVREIRPEKEMRKAS